MNSRILSIRDKGYYSAEWALKDIKYNVEYATNTYEIQHGYANLEFSTASLDFIIKLCREREAELWKDYAEYSGIYNRRINNGESAESLIDLRKKIEKFYSSASSYKSTVALLEERRRSAKKREDDVARIALERDSDWMVIFKCVIVIVMCFVAFSIAMNGNAFMGAVALLGSSWCGYYILKDVLC